MEITEKDLKTTMDALLNSRDDKILKENATEIKELANRIDLTQPQKYFFNEQFNQESILEMAFKLKMAREGYQENYWFIHIYLNYNSLEDYLSNIFKKTLGYTCSTDKARFVLKAILNKELKGHGTLRPKTDKKSFSDPFYRKFNDWSDLIRTCPIVTTSRSIEHSNALMNIVENINKAQNKRNDYIKDFTEWLLNSVYRNELCEIREGKVLSYETMFKKDPTNAYDWLKVKSPHIIKIWKNS